ncbi:hypothetical protein T09_5999 [Trichinella sp. T9]|nr:hypothetical protein T09_5999 [Trichinella sp. T9]
MKQINLEGHDYMSQRTVNATARQTAIPVSAQKPTICAEVLQTLFKDFKYLPCSVQALNLEMGNLNEIHLPHINMFSHIARIAATLFT